VYTKAYISLSPNIVIIMNNRYKKRFYKFDKESKGFITTLDVQQVLEVSYNLNVIIIFKKVLILSRHYFFLKTIFYF